MRVGTLPQCRERNAQSVLWQNIQIEIEHRIMFGDQHVVAAYFVLAV